MRRLVVEGREQQKRTESHTSRTAFAHSSQEEKQLFFQRMKEVGVDGKWGIFSITIPGRVGYQCSNFYRHLLKSGQITDPNYTFDEKGNPRYLFKKAKGPLCCFFYCVCVRYFARCFMPCKGVFCSALLFLFTLELFNY